MLDDFALRAAAFDASRLAGELDELEHHVVDPSDELALITVKAWARDLVDLVHHVR